MTYSPALNTPQLVTSTYSSPRTFQRSYKVLPPALLQFSRESHSTYRRNGDSSSRDNWILGKGANVHDGWDGWSVVQGEKRYWDSKLSKPEFRGKCGGAAANRLSEEKIIKKQNQNALHDVDVPAGTRKTDVLYDRRSDQISSIADSLFKEYFPELAPVTISSPRRAVAAPVTSTPKSPRKQDVGSSSKFAQQPLVNHSSKILKHALGDKLDLIPTPPQRVGIPQDSPLKGTNSVTPNRSNQTTNLASTCCGRGSLTVAASDSLAPAGMPTNGAHHQHLPQVANSKAEKRR